MNHRISLGIILVLIVFSFSVEAASACNADAVIKEVQKTLSQLTSYKLKTRIKLNGTSAKAEIVGKQPDRLKITMSVESRSGPRVSKAIFNGAHQWVQKGEGSEAEVLKINLQKTTTAQRPFDTGYYMMGTGLLNGESFPSTIQNLTSFYDLEAECKGSDTHLTGVLIPEKFQSFAEQRNSPRNGTKYVERFKRQFRYLNLSLNRETRMVKSYSIGPSSEEEVINVDFSEVKIDPKIKEGAFDYKPPEGKEPKNITDLILKRQRMN